VPSVTVLVSLLVCLIPTTIGGLLSAIGIAGMDRVMQHNVLAMSGKAVEAAGDVNTLLLDKTGTITLGNRQAVEFIPGGVTEERTGRRRAAFEPGRRNAGRPLHRGAGQGEVRHPRREVAEHEAHFIPFTAQTRMSGVDIDGRRIARAPPNPSEFVHEQGRHGPAELMDMSDASRAGRHAAGGGRWRPRCWASSI
jgi:potassium-transporting ATPase ATP-binding subunit